MAALWSPVKDWKQVKRTIEIRTVRRDAARLQKKTGCCLPVSTPFAGMTCCGAALAPDPFFDQPFRASVPLLIPPDLPTSGLPPEALPKPPKSFA